MVSGRTTDGSGALSDKCMASQTPEPASCHHDFIRTFLRAVCSLSTAQARFFSRFSPRIRLKRLRPKNPRTIRWMLLVPNSRLLSWLRAVRGTGSWSVGDGEGSGVDEAGIGVGVLPELSEHSSAM